MFNRSNTIETSILCAGQPKVEHRTPAGFLAGVSTRKSKAKYLDEPFVMVRAVGVSCCVRCGKFSTTLICYSCDADPRGVLAGGLV